jgi:lipopolysaccharide/colanic/teichoic acid biosynthesis glycosyltransferase
VSPLVDRVLGGLVLAIASPLLGAAALAIRLESPGPAFYRQRRVGLHGEPFELVKLRTMVSGAEALGAGLAVDAGDPRITRVGALLRRLSVDELPNLVNVVRGEMALVGPRPTVQAQVDQYTDRQRRRLEVRPGITGWAQVNGRASLPWHERIELDVWYVERRSLALDLEILARTLELLVTGRGLYRGHSGGWRPDVPPTGAARAAAPAFPPRRTRRAGRRPPSRPHRRWHERRSRRSG